LDELDTDTVPVGERIVKISKDKRTRLTKHELQNLEQDDDAHHSNDEDDTLEQTGDDGNDGDDEDGEGSEDNGEAGTRMDRRGKNM
jgi:hypothetical protein